MRSMTGEERCLFSFRTLQLRPSSGAARHLLPEGEGQDVAPYFFPNTSSMPMSSHRASSSSRPAPRLEGSPLSQSSSS